MKRLALALVALAVVAAPARADGGKELFGTILGGAGGAVAGAQFGKGSGRLAATAAGTLLGAVAGGSFGRSADRADRLYYGEYYGGHRPRHAGWGPPPRFAYNHPPPVVFAPPPVVYAPPPRVVYVQPRTVYVQPSPAYAYDGGLPPGAQMVRDGYDSSGHYCREYQQSVVVGGAVRPGYGIACMMPDGSWRIVE